MVNWLFKEIPVYKVYLGWLTFLFLLVVIGLIVNLSSHRKEKAQIIIVRSDETQIIIALKAYSNSYGVLPIGDAESIERILIGENLQGKNPQKTAFLNFIWQSEHPNGMIDPWGTPYQIEFLQQTNFVIRSAGRNRKFGDKDDIIFNSISNHFVKP
ncbi:MAG TPA: hypothetical protein VHG89_00590 [Verrucomicrobiae bacterium]|nr:hypothetical protein [Verrucomicrobiae bacterium]